MDRGYELRYLPVFYDDLYKIVSYIREKLLNPTAADDLLDEVEAAIMN